MKPKPAPILDEPLLTAREVAALLKVSAKTVYNLRFRGLPCYLISESMVRFRKAAVEAWLEQQQDTELVVKLVDVSL